MNRVALFRILNPALAVLVLCQVTTIGIMVLHPSETIMLVHKLIGSALVLGIALHFISNWNWVRSTYFPKARKAQSHQGATTRVPENSVR